MDESLSQVIFIIPPTTALNRNEFDTIIAHRRAFNLVQTANVNPIWKAESELLEIAEADLTKLYVLHEFIGNAYGHLSGLKCRVISSLVVLQSYKYQLDFPMRTTPTWAQSLQRNIVCAIGFSVNDENEIRDKVLKLGGRYKTTIGHEVALILVGTFNSDDPWIQFAAENNILVLKKEWLEQVQKSSIKLEQDCAKFFEPTFLRQHQIRVSNFFDITQNFPFNQPVTTVAEVVPSQQFNQDPFQHVTRRRIPLSPTPSARNSNAAFDVKPAITVATSQAIFPPANNEAQTVTDEQPPVNVSLQFNSMASRKRQSFGSPGYRHSGSASSRRSRTITSMNARESSPEYVSQGPVMMNNSTTTDDTVNHAIIWDDKLEKATQAVAISAQPSMQEGLSQFLSEPTNNIEEGHNDDIFMDDEEKEMLSRLTKK